MKKKGSYSNKETEQIAFHLFTNYSLRNEVIGLSAKNLAEYVLRIFRKGNYKNVFTGMEDLSNVQWGEIAPIRIRRR